MWRDHSRTIVGLVTGSAIIVVALVLFPNGGPAWDIVSGIGIVLLTLAIEGGLNNYFRETAKPEDEP